MKIMGINRLERSEGKVEIVTGMYLLIFLILVLTVQQQVNYFALTHIFMEDALAASNLASAVIDVREYGISHTVRIASAAEAFAIYQKALQENLNLNERWEYGNKTLISSPVEILQYTIYNVEKEDVTICSYDRYGGYSTWKVENGLGSVYTPDGTRVESTSIYSRIGFTVEGILGVSIFADQDNTVDIIGSMTEETEG